MLNEDWYVAGRLSLMVNNETELLMDHVSTIITSFSVLKNELSDRSDGALIHLNNIAINSPMEL